MRRRSACDKAGIKLVATARFARTDTRVTGRALKRAPANSAAIRVVACASAAALPHKGLVERGHAKRKICQTHGAARFDLTRVGGADVEGLWVVSGLAAVAGKLPGSNASRVLGGKYLAESGKADGKGLANPFGADPFDVVIGLDKVSLMALKKATPGARAFRTALNMALETIGRTPVPQAVLNFTAAGSFGFTPETGAMLKVVSGEWQVVPNRSPDAPAA